jgi:hypothetical protein
VEWRLANDMQRYDRPEQWVPVVLGSLMRAAEFGLCKPGCTERGVRAQLVAVYGLRFDNLIWPTLRPLLSYTSGGRCFRLHDQLAGGIHHRDGDRFVVNVHADTT